MLPLVSCETLLLHGDTDNLSQSTLKHSNRGFSYPSFCAIVGGLVSGQPWDSAEYEQASAAVPLIIRSRSDVIDSHERHNARSSSAWYLISLFELPQKIAQARDPLPDESNESNSMGIHFTDKITPATLYLTMTLIRYHFIPFLITRMVNGPL